MFLAQVNQLQGGKPAFQPTPQSTGAVEGQVAQQAAPVAGQDPQAGSPMVTLMMMLGLFVFFYFIAIRPQQKQQAKHKTFVESLKEKDEVITNAGIIGKIVQLDDKVIRLEVDKNTRIRVLREQVSRLYEPESAEKRK